MGNYSYCELVRGTDYTIEYCNNTAIGEASVLISGIGNYSGSVTRTFDIVNDEGFAKKEGVERLTTETGAGQWGTALSLACNLLDLDCTVYSAGSAGSGKLRQGNGPHGSQDQDR